MRGGRHPWLSTAGFYGLAGLFMLPTVFVFYWMITLSLKPQVEAMAYPPSFVRFSVTAAGYREVFTKYPFFLYTWNSLVVAAGCTALAPLGRSARSRFTRSESARARDSLRMTCRFRFFTSLNPPFSSKTSIVGSSDREMIFVPG